MHDADHRLVRFFKRNQNTPKSITLHEVSCAVDGIDNPTASAEPLLEEPSFTEDAVVRKLAFDGFADEALAILAGDGDRRSIRFGLRGTPGARMCFALSPAAVARRRANSSSRS
jgi:hypothetical protein